MVLDAKVMLMILITTVSPSLHSEMISQFHPSSGTTSCSLRGIILTLAVLRHFKGSVSTQALGIFAQKVTGCPLFVFMQVTFSSEDFNDR